MTTADEARANGYEVVTIHNDSNEKLEVTVEPWAIGASLAPDESCELWLLHDDATPSGVCYARESGSPYMTFEAISFCVRQNGKMMLDWL